MNHKPESPLPWRLYSESDYIPDRRMILSESIDDGNLGRMWEEPDAEYVVHACNAYPKLVEIVRKLADGEDPTYLDAKDLLKELGEL